MRIVSENRGLTPAALSFLVCASSFACTHRRHAPSAHVGRYVFVDGGAHLGETVLGFEKSKLASKHAWSIVSFEPNPELAPQIPKRPNLEVRQEAIWTQDEELEFRFASNDSLGGSIMNSVVQVPNMKTVTVHAVDFGAWLKKTFRKEDVLYVKLDIEGAEYPVIEQMLKDGSMRLVDKLFVEFHGVQQAKASGAADWQIVEVEKHDHELVEAITSLGIAVSLHTNEEPQGSYFEFDPEKWGQTW